MKHSETPELNLTDRSQAHFHVHFSACKAGNGPRDEVIQNYTSVLGYQKVRMGRGEDDYPSEHKREG